MISPPQKVGSDQQSAPKKLQNRLANTNTLTPTLLLRYITPIHPAGHCYPITGTNICDFKPGPLGISEGI